MSPSSVCRESDKPVPSGRNLRAAAMKIKEIVFLPHRLKRKYRWQTASYTADYVELFYVTIRTDHGLTGIGAASVMPSRGDPLQTGIAALKPVVDALFMKRDPLEIDDLMELLDQQ